MKIYWIIVDGQPRGPFTPDEIASMGVVSPSLRVWHKGLPEWVTIDHVPELASLLPQTESPETVENEVVMVEEVREVHEVHEVKPAPEPVRMAASFVDRGNTDQRMPATYLPWNILATICCCLPVGVVGIIFSSQVTSKFNAGDVAGSRKASERAAWCLIVAIVLGLIALPFQFLFSGL